ncbi:MAG: flagellar motor switch protein FliM, partial [Caulobacteraceae bacterium]|nr:flagellar motor switch protein FliM [Caulobacteraceae bacterium]
MAEAAQAETNDWAGGEAEPGEERILNQEEIDSLLGFDIGEEDDARTGIKAIINSALVSYERLPMLEIVF